MIQTNMKNYLCLPQISGFWTILFWEYVHVSKCFFSLKEGLTLHFNILEFPLQNYSLYQVLLKFSIREKVDFVKIKIKMYTVYRQKTDGRRPDKKSSKSLLKLSAQVHLIRNMHVITLFEM